MNTNDQYKVIRMYNGYRVNTITLGQLSDIQNNQHVSVIVKVLQVDEKLEVKPKLYKQDVTLCDSTGTARLISSLARRYRQAGGRTLVQH